ncbi:hypothetical protein SXIM_43250 [Streptomyces xiamenensis]|uniref:Uncharacterized protein n=1 Tax=Streptomyces xiamenensis TaxID=408015 RepID=A0A0F7FZN5_9ACTN|nr:hypothetical protein [Streptomyces xiamenensis]AKG45709.1 hypothetical protein SXIM_43250 [Streptomyces xiamenensis]
MYGDLNIDIVRERIESLRREARHERLLREAGRARRAADAARPAVTGADGGQERSVRASVPRRWLRTRA